jgi:glutathione synthase/RimK-type ligase-like ATP-grasp enzyme
MRIAFLTLRDRGNFVIDDEHAIAKLVRRGCEVDEIPWQNDAPFQTYDCVMVRSTWDYQQAPQAFLGVLERIAAVTTLWNPIDVIRWNIRKTYLRDLAAKGVPIVPTTFGSGSGFRDLITSSGRAVLKPVVSANAYDTFVLGDPERDAPLASIESTFERREWLFQPFVTSVETEGEHSLFYFANEYSHAVLKQPKAGDFRVQEEHGGIITPEQPAPDLRRVADAVIAAMGRPLAQARVDLVRLDDGTPALMELELIEPSLYFRTDPRAPDNFADALMKLQSKARS